MRLKDLILKYNWSDVRNRFLEIYPDQLKNIAGYEDLYYKLTEMAEMPIKMTIQINKYFDESAQKEAIDLIGYYNDADPNDPEQQFALELTPWNEWIGMNIDPVTINENSPVEIIAHCFYEMTFLGFNEDEIQKSWE